MRRWIARIRAARVLKFRRPQPWEWVVFVVLGAALVACGIQAKDAANLKEVLFWFAGMLLTCESILSFTGLQGRIGAVWALCLRLLTFAGAYFALRLDGI